jgi:hypothetical protein
MLTQNIYQYLFFSDNSSESDAYALGTLGPMFWTKLFSDFLEILCKVLLHQINLGIYITNICYVFFSFLF